MSAVRHVRRAAAGAAVVVSVAALATGPAGADRAPTGHGSAFGLSANGPVSVPVISAVASHGKPAERSLVSVPDNPLLSAKVLHTNAEKAKARASVADVLIKKLKLKANAVTAKCTQGMGSVDLVAAELDGKRLAVSPSPNSALHADLGPLGKATVTLNKQTRNADGTLTVTAVEARVPVAGKMETVTISSATCGKEQAAQPAPQKPGGPKAPKPTPVHHDLPVTG